MKNLSAIVVGALGAFFFAQASAEGACNPPKPGPKDSSIKYHDCVCDKEGLRSIVEGTNDLYSELTVRGFYPTVVCDSNHEDSGDFYLKGSKIIDGKIQVNWDHSFDEPAIVFTSDELSYELYFYDERYAAEQLGEKMLREELSCWKNGVGIIPRVIYVSKGLSDIDGYYLLSYGITNIGYPKPCDQE